MVFGDDGVDEVSGLRLGGLRVFFLVFSKVDWYNCQAKLP